MASAYSTRFTVTRWDVVTEECPQDLRQRYETAVPALPTERVADLASRGAPWSEMLDLIHHTAPLGFLIYARNDVGAVMSLTGNMTPCTAYLMGNHTIAERMFRHQPQVMQYAPLRTTIWGDTQGRAHLTFDQPSDLFASFGDDAVTAVGVELDGKLATLLAHLDLTVPPALLADTPGATVSAMLEHLRCIAGEDPPR
jgi:uncharacterized protein (DUF302 family)